MQNPSLIIKNLNKCYGNNIKANHNISLEFKSGEITALIGHNGAGKSTLLNQIIGLVRPTSGEIYINHIDIIKNHTKARDFVSSMPQFQVPLKGVTVFQAIESISMIKGFSKEMAKKKARDIIQYLQINKFMNIPGEKLSGGLRRLTSFAMSVIDNAPIIVLDEPTNDVDPIRRILIWKYLRKLSNHGTIIIIVTHNLLEVEKYSDRYILLDKGGVKEDVSILSKYHKSNQHILKIFNIDKSEIYPFFHHFKIKYNENERNLIIFLEEEEFSQAIPLLFTVLKKNKAISYNLKPQTLDENYEGIINGEDKK